MKTQHTNIFSFMEESFGALSVEAIRTDTGQKNQMTSILYDTVLAITPKESDQE